MVYTVLECYDSAWQFYSRVAKHYAVVCQCGLLLLYWCRRTENVPNAEGNTPLHLAVINDNPQCVKLLLIHGADMHISKSVTRTVCVDSIVKMLF